MNCKSRFGQKLIQSLKDIDWYFDDSKQPWRLGVDVSQFRQQDVVVLVYVRPGGGAVFRGAGVGGAGAAVLRGQRRGAAWRAIRRRGAALAEK